MSHDPSDAPSLQPLFGAVPQPGADPGGYKSNGLPCADIGPGHTAEIGPGHTAEWPPDFLPDWPKLPGKHAVNFAYDDSLKAVRIIKAEKDADAWTIEEVWPEPPGPPAFKCLYRVWGDWAVSDWPDWAAWDIGRYWTDVAPKSEDDFYGKVAVEFHWNSGRYVATLANAGPITEIRGWSGTIARQPADGMDPRHQPTTEPYPGYYLRGGVTQYFIPDGTLPFIKEQHTEWNPPKLRRETIPRPDIQVAPPGKGAVANIGHYEALAIWVDYLAQLLEAASKEGAEFGFRNSPPTGQAAILHATGGQLGAHARYLPAAAAKAQSKLIAQSLVPIARYLDGYPQRGSYGGEIEGAIDEVVRWAYAIGVEAA